MVDWDATDQFGNLYVGHSQASSLEELRPDLEDLLDKLEDRSSGPIVLSVDLEYGQVKGPLPDQVSHVLNAPVVQSLVDDGMGTGELLDAIREIVGMEVLVVLAD